MERSAAACFRLSKVSILAWTLAAALSFDPASADGEELVVGPGAEIPITAPAPGLAVEAALGGGLTAPPPGSPPAPLRAPEAEGSYWLALVSRDDAGNPSPVRWARLVVDATPPRVVLGVEPQPAAGGGGVRWVARGAVLTARAEDDLTSVGRTGVAAGESVAESEGRSATVPVPGDRRQALTLSGWAEDAVGNRSGEARLEVMLDPWPPQGRIECSGPCVEAGDKRVIAADTRLEAHVEDPDSGVARTDLEVDGAAVGPEGWDGPWPNDTYEVSVTVTDRAGNAGTLGPVRLAVDRDGPQITWEERPSGELRVRAEDRPAGVESVEWSPDGGLWMPLRGPLSGRALGRRGEIRLRATDRVGNRSEEVVRRTMGGGR